MTTSADLPARRRRFLRAGTAGMVLLCSACAVGPDFVTPEVEMPASFSRTDADSIIEAAAEVPATWWEVFDDPLLNQLVVDAYAQNLDIESAGLRIVEARAALGIARGSRWPQQQELGGGALRTGLSSNSPNFFSLLADDRYWNTDFGIDMAWELDIWGRFRRGIEATEAEMAAAIAGFDAAAVRLAAETTSTYITFRSLQELLRVTRENVALQQRSFEITTALADNQLVSELDVRQAQTLLTNTQAEVPLLEASLVQAANALAVLLGQEPGALDALLGEGAIPAPPPEVAVGVPAELLRRRPDVRVAEYLAAAQSARVGIATADKYPSFALLGSLGLRSADTGGSSIDLFSSDSIEYVAGPVFALPFLNYGRIQNAVRVQDARLQQRLVEYRSTVLNAAREAEDAIAGYLRTREASQYYAESAESARRSVDLALLQYREGIVDYQRVLDTQRALNVQQARYVQSRNDVAVNLVLLFKALGGGWELRDGRPIIDERSIEEMQDRTNWGDLLDTTTAAAQP